MDDWIDDFQRRWEARQMFDPPLGHISIAGRPICLIPESEEKYGSFLACSRWDG